MGYPCYIQFTTCQRSNVHHKSKSVNSMPRKVKGHERWDQKVDIRPWFTSTKTEDFCISVPSVSLSSNTFCKKLLPTALPAIPCNLFKKNGCFSFRLPDVENSGQLHETKLLHSLGGRVTGSNSCTYSTLEIQHLKVQNLTNPKKCILYIHISK